MKRIFAILLLICLVLSLSACGGIGSVDKPTKKSESSTAESNKTTGSTEASTEAGPQETYALEYVQEGLDAEAVSSQNFSFSKGAMCYFFSLNYSDFISQNGSYLSYYGLDTSVSLKEQVYEGEETWFDFFMSQATSFAEQYLIFAEYAKAQGLSLDQADEEYIDSQEETIRQEAAAYGWDADTYIGQVLGTNIPLSAVTEATRVMLLADKGYDALMSSLSISDERIEKEYADNHKAYDLIDFVFVDLLAAADLAEADLKALQDAFDAAKTRADFEAALKLYVEKCVSKEDPDKYSGAAGYAENMMKSSNLAVGYTYYDDDEFMKWAFNGAKADECYLGENDGTHQYAYLLVKEPYRNTDSVVDIRHILFGVSTYGDAAKAHARAEEIEKEWIAAGADEDSFIDYCAQYSEDGNASTGGIYEGVTKGMMVAEFDEWIFDSSRVYGDYGLVDTTYGTHIMFFVGRHESWYGSVKEALLQKDYDAAVDEMKAATVIKTQEAVLEAINW